MLKVICLVGFLKSIKKKEYLDWDPNLVARTYLFGFFLVCLFGLVFFGGGRLVDWAGGFFVIFVCFCFSFWFCFEVFNICFIIEVRHLILFCLDILRAML